jgi:hypothetical protein
MIVSSSSKLASGNESSLTPAMVRGVFLIWRSELQLGQQFAEIREFDSRASVTHTFARGAFGVDTDTADDEFGGDRTSWGTDLSDTGGW